MNIPEFKSDFIDAVNGVIEKHLSILYKAPKKEEFTAISENLFVIILRMLVLTDKIKSIDKK